MKMTIFAASRKCLTDPRYVNVYRSGKIINYGAHHGSRSDRDEYTGRDYRRYGNDLVYRINIYPK